MSPFDGRMVDISERLSLALLALGAGVAAAQEGGPRPDVPWEDSEGAIAEAEQARAHQRMPDTMYASTPSEDKPYFAHPPTTHRAAGRGSWHTTAALFQPLNATGETAEDVFRQSISEPVVQAKCINCHVVGGASGHSRLVFAPASTNDHLSRNYRAFDDFLVSVPNGAALILDKIKGVAHGGGVQMRAGSALYADMQRFLDLLDGGDGAPVTVETLFDTVRDRPNRETLYRAAIILAGRIPTDAEYAAVENAGLLATVRGLMAGPGFHDFLIRAANDRLLTDGADPIVGYGFANGVNENVRLIKAIRDEIDGSRRVYYHHSAGVDFGLTRAPLELVAHVVENDLPYLEILTADYVMANPQTAIVYGAKDAHEEFGGSDNVHEFRPARIDGYYPASSVECEFEEGVRVSCRGVGPRFTHPHAGILGTQALLYRYPTTPTNRNRARARWTYYHFLGVDVERLGVRVLDPNSLVDRDNPTMNNPACTGCHEILDPVAGTFQHYDEFGFYKARDQHSLPHSYTGERHQSIGSQIVPLEPRTVTFRGHLSDHGQRYTLIKLWAEGDGLLYLSDFAVLNTDGRYVLKEREAGSLWNTYYDCRISRDPVVLENGCGVNVSLPLPDAPDWLRRRMDVTSAVRLSAGDYRFEVTAWSSGTMSLHARLDYGSAFRSGDTWFRDMRKPGFDGVVAPENADSLEWLGRKVAEDRRFAEATVKFWWPAIMGREVVRPPTDRSDADFESRLLEAQAQGEEVERLARMFRNGSRGGGPYNLKDLLAELVLSRWFRANRIADANQMRRAALRSAGAARPLTPEELVAKTEALTGYVWGREREEYGPERDRPMGHLQDDYAPLYGGIDSEDVTKRSRRFTAPAAQIAKLHANSTAILVVYREFLLLPNHQRSLFSGLDLSATPESAPDEIRAKLAELHEKFFGVRAGAKEVRDTYRFFAGVWRDAETMYPRLRNFAPGVPMPLTGDHFVWECVVVDSETDDCYLEGIRDDALEWRDWRFVWNTDVVDELGDGIEWTVDEMRMALTWSTMLAAMLMDYRYLHL